MVVQNVKIFIYYGEFSGENIFTNKYLYDRWPTSIIFGYFIIDINLGFAMFGFLLPSQTKGSRDHFTISINKFFIMILIYNLFIFII